MRGNAARAQEADVFVPYRRAAPITDVRSTVIVSGIQALRARGHYERYLERLPEERRAEVLGLIAGRWQPIDLGLIHYRAANALGLDTATVDGIGAEVADRLNKTALSVAVKLSKEAGVTPWTALAQAQRITDINWRGSAIAVVKLGPKEARYDWVGQPCADIPYFVTSFGGFLRALASLFCTRAYVRALPDRCSAAALSYRLSWA